jgi:Sulfotransferase domain
MKVNFLISGVQRGGTSSLAAYLRQHPQIGMARKKELHFFDSEIFFSSDKPDYTEFHKWFEQSEQKKLYGEATPIYIYWEPAMRRALQYNPDMKFVVLLRDPTNRAWSQWKMNASQGRDTASFSEAIRNEPSRVREALPLQHRAYSYVDRGYYSVQIRRMFSFFERKQTLFLKSEDFFRDPARELGKVYEFLGIDTFNADTRRAYNVDCNNESMSFADRDFLNQTFRSDVEEVKSLLGWDCVDWLRSF